MSLHECCIKGFKWSGTPTGKVSKLNNNDVCKSELPKLKQFHLNRH